MPRSSQTPRAPPAPRRGTAGETTASGAACGSSRRRRSRSGVLLPPRCSIRTSSSSSRHARPDDGGERARGRRPSSREGVSAGAARRGTGCALPGSTRREDRLARRRAGARARRPTHPSPTGLGDGSRAGGDREPAASSQTWRQYDTFCMVVTWLDRTCASDTETAICSTPRSRRCSRTASAGRRHPTSPAAAASRGRRCTATGPTRRRCSRRSSRASCSRRCPPAPADRDDLDELVAAARRDRRPRCGGCRSSTGCATPIPSCSRRYILDRLGTSQRAIHAEPLAAQSPRGRSRLRARRRPRGSSPRWCCSSRSPRCSPRRSWRSGCRRTRGGPSSRAALRGYLGGARR